MKRAIALTAAALCASIALAPAGAAAQGADAWQFQASLYAYLPSIGGQTTFPQSGGGSSVSVDASTILDNLKMAFMGSLEGRKGLWGAFTDIVYVDLGNSKSDSRSLAIGGVVPADATASADYDLKGWVWTLGGTYRAVSKPDYAMDVLAGARVLDIRQKLDWSFSGNVGSIALPDRSGSREASLQNWDAIVGVKGRYAFGEGRKWFVPYYVDIGTGESQFTWQAMGGIGYSFGWGDVVGAWRYLDYQMKSGKAIESLNFNGPAIAAVFRW